MGAELVISLPDHCALPLVGDPLLEWLPGETLFSLVSRLHRLWGRTHDSDTAQILFGGRTRGVHHDFPSGLGYFIDRSDGALGSPDEIARQRTLLHFRSEEHTSELPSLMR